MFRKSEPIVTVLIPCFNQAAYLADCLNSILNQTYRNIHIILSDDASTDKSKDVILELFDKFIDSDISMTFHIQKNNLGGYGRNNHRFLFNQPINTKYVAILEGDDYLEVDSMEKKVALLEATDSDAVHTDVRVVYQDGSLKSSRWWHDNGCFIKNPMTVESQLANNRVFTCSLLAKTELYKKAFQADFFTSLNIHLGDYACSTRIARLTNSFIYIDQPLSVYREVVGSESHRDRELTIRDTGNVSNLGRTGKLFEDLK